MATESSAIARFVNLTQSQGLVDPAREGIVDITQPLPPPGQAAPVTAIPAQARRPQASGSSSGMWLALVGFVVIGGAVAGGYLLAQQQSGEAKGPSLNTIGGTTAGVAAQTPANAASAERSPEAALVAAPLDAGEDTIDPDLDPGLAAAEAQAAGEALPVLDVELAKKTGFDILVEPSGAKVSLDGHDIGSAPLRVRNLLPGLHGVDIEGPAGYFGKHMEFELIAGEAQVLELVLEAVDTDASNTPAADTALKVEPIVDVKNKSIASTKPKKKSSEDPRKSKKKAQAQTKSSSKRASAVKALDSKGEVSLGTLMLGAKPPCQIIIDGKNTGLTTPQRAIQLPEGAHRVILVNDEHGIKKAFKVNIKAGRTTRAIQDLSTKL